METLETTALETQLSQTVSALRVSDQESYNRASALVDQCDRVLERINQHHDPIIKAAHAAHKAALAAKKALADRFETIKADAKRKMTNWYLAEQRRVQEERLKAEAEARKQAEEARLREAEALAQAGMTEAADAALDAPVDLTAFIREPQAPVAGNGVCYRANWKAEVVNLMVLVKAVADGKAPMSYLEPNMTALNQAAKAFKNTQEIPGVRQFNDTVQARR
jgi:hypothetical protein